MQVNVSVCKLATNAEIQFLSYFSSWFSLSTHLALCHGSVPSRAVRADHRRGLDGRKVLAEPPRRLVPQRRRCHGVLRVPAVNRQAWATKKDSGMGRFGTIRQAIS
jgi:hypothetical protein